MSLSNEAKKYLNVAADETLDTFEGVSREAQKKVEGFREDSSNTLSQNPWKSDSADQNLSQIQASLHSDYLKLKFEPAIARVVVEDENDKHKVYYICRGTPVSGVDAILASYNSPVGRMASLDVGDEYKLPNGSLVEIVEISRLRPYKSDGSWDSKDTVLETDSFGPLTIKSLRALSSKVEELGIAGAEEGFDPALLERLLAEEPDEANIQEGLRRSVIEKMGLRDQPILDKYQDEIFRLPLNKTLFLLGPPGTGKTTTLIRRLGQKSDLDYLEDDEKRLVKEASHLLREPHERSWIMFTPTDLLKLFVKEAFAREGVPASDRNIRTWTEFRREVGRNVFHILRTTNGGTFVLKDRDEHLQDDITSKLIDWCDDFESWQQSKFINELHVAAKELREDSKEPVARIGEKLFSILNRDGKINIADLFISIVRISNDVRQIEEDLKKATNTKIEETINIQLNRDHYLLDNLSEKIEEIQKSESVSEEIEDDIEEDDFVSTGTKRGNAVNAYKQALRAQARAFVNKRTVSSKTRSGQLLEWVGERSLSTDDQGDIGAKLITLTHVRKFKNPLRRYLNGIQGRYKIFRKERRAEGKWYRDAELHANDIHPLELDIIIYSIMNCASLMINKRSVLRDIEDTQWSSLMSVYSLFRNQIYVDEATDFSPVQLACMGKLTHPGLDSFFACGDFNQRLTTWGSRCLEDFQWVRGRAEIKKVNIVYRQSRQLNELAISIIKAVNGDGAQSLPVLPKEVDSEGVSPVLIENEPDPKKICQWLASRVGEVESMVQKLPSIAVFVDSEQSVSKVAEDLNFVLEQSNIQAIACPNGQVMGNDNDVRVFDVQHIKGLEFEAVFFVGVDKLAALQPDLFDKYLYVGITRAATYLGVTCDGELPAVISSLRSQFVERWDF